MRSGFTKPPPGAQINWGHPLARGLVGCWLFNEGAGLAAHDLAQGNTATLASSGVLWKPTDKGLALELNGVNGSNLSVANRSMLQFTSRATFHARIRMSAAPSNQHTLAAKGSALDYIWAVAGGGAADTNVSVFDGGAWNQMTFSSSFVQDTWYDLTTTWDGAQYVGYRNGERVTAASSTAFNTSADALKIGSRFNGTFAFAGNMALFLLYDYPLPDPLARQLHAAPYAFLLEQSPRKYFYGALGAAAVAGVGWKTFRRDRGRR